MSHEIGVHKKHHITSADRFRGQTFQRVASGTRDIITATKKWAEVQHEMLLLKAKRIKHRRNRRKDPDMWA